MLSAEDFSRIYDQRYGPTWYTSVFFFSESILSDESDLNCFNGHILNEEIDRAKVMYSRKQEEFSGLISQQPKPRYIFLEMNLGRLSHPRRCHRSRMSLNNQCSNTPDTSGEKPNIKKNSLLVLSSVENLQKVKLKEFCYVS